MELFWDIFWFIIFGGLAGLVLFIMLIDTKHENIGASLLIILVFSILAFPFGYDLYKDIKAIYEEHKVETFLENNFPKIIRNRDSIIEKLKMVDEKIEKLTDLKNQFPNQAKLINEYLNRWETVKNKLDQSLINLNKQTEAIYVKNEISGINNSGYLNESFSAYNKDLEKEIGIIFTEIDTINKVYENEIR